jgi:hypothetical protein
MSVDKQKNLSELIDLLNDLYKDEDFKENICMSYRHDFGLMTKEDQELLMFEAKEWIRAIINNLPYINKN